MKDWQLKLVRLLALLAMVPAGASPVAAAEITAIPRPTVVGAADPLGRVRLVRELGHLEMGVGRDLPVYLLFGTDPAAEPGTFGPYWQLPLFEGYARMKDAETLSWMMPKGTLLTLKRDPTAETRGDVEIYRLVMYAMVAERDGNRVRVAYETPSGRWFEYVDGRLHRFQWRNGAPVIRVYWKGSGRLWKATDEATGATVVEVAYRGSVWPTGMRIGDREFEVEMGTGGHLAPSGKRRYRDLGMRFLTAWRSADGSLGETCTYPEPEERTRSGKPVQIHRMETMTVSDGKDWVEWEVESGFAVADSGGRYVVKNPSLDPLESTKGPIRREATAKLVRVGYLPEGSETEQEYWEYNRKTGIREWQTADGARTREWIIQGRGPAGNKLRRKEIWKNGQWKEILRRSYDPEGRKIREINPEGITVWDYAGFNEAGQEILNVYKNGELYREMLQENGRTVFMRRYDPEPMGVYEVFIEYLPDGSRRRRSFVRGELNGIYTILPNGELKEEFRRSHGVTWDELKKRMMK